MFKFRVAAVAIATIFFTLLGMPVWVAAVLAMSILFVATFAL